MEWAARRAAARGLPLHVVHACRTDPGSGFGPPSDTDSLHAAGEALLARTVARAHSISSDLHVSTACVPGFASKTLIQVSSRAAMVVIGAVGHGIISRASIGPTTLQVAMSAHCPVVIIGHEGRTSDGVHGRVVVGVDGSAHSLTALSEAFERAALRGAELQIVHAWQTKRAGHPVNALATAAATNGAGTNGSTSGGWPDHESGLERLIAEEISARAASHPEVTVAQDVVKADPVRVLGDHSRSADLVIVGRRGVGGFPGLRLGSVAVRLMGHTACPLVIAPMPAEVDAA